MANFINYKYNEIDYAKCVYENGFQTKHIPTEMKLLLLYARDYLGTKKSQLKNFAYEFCEKHVEGFNRVLWFKTINKAVNFASTNKNKLLNVGSVGLTDGEISYITALPFSQDYKKLFLAFLVQAKLNKVVYEFKNEKEYTSSFFKGGIKKYNEVKKMANVTGKVDINGDFIHDVSKEGYIAIYYNGLIKHLWMDDCKASGETVIEIVDFENVGWYLDYYCGVKGVKLCKECLQPYRANSKEKVYCKKCKVGLAQPKRKRIICADCGVELEVNAKANNQRRCAECQEKHRSEYLKDR